VYTIKNPCVDSSIVSISAPQVTLAAKSYVIDSTAETWTPFSGSYTLSTLSSICGNILLTP